MNNSSTPLWPLLSLILAATLLTSLLDLPTAQAQDAKIQMAQQLATDGNKAYEAGNYKLALRKYRAAYELVPHGILLYNVSRSHGALGEYKDALQTAEQVKLLGDEIDKETQSKNQAYIASYRVILSGRRFAKDAKDASIKGADPNGETSSRNLTTLGWTGVGAAGVGTGLLVTSFILSLRIGPQIDAFDQDKERVQEGNLSPEEADLDNRADELQTRQTTGLILLFSGGVLVATGAVLIVLDLLNSPEKKPESSATLYNPRLLGGPTRGGFAMGLGFDF